MILAYAVGSIPTGLWIGKALRGIDIREHGSGNTGATNAARVLGKKIGATILFLDILKGFAPVIVLPTLFGMNSDPALVAILIGASAVAGHCFSVFLQFSGGKGVATALGVFLAIAPWEMLFLLVVGGILIAWKGYVSLASVTGAILLPFLLYFFGQPAIVLFVGEILAVIIIVRHRANLTRIREGREMRVWDTVFAPADDEPIPTVEPGETSN
jgi:glycerol-3-phosphate acyltransferase PlsY